MASSLGVDDALLRKLVDVIVVGTPRNDSNQRGNAKTNRGRNRKIALKILPGGSTARSAPVVPDGRGLR